MTTNILASPPLGADRRNAEHLHDAGPAPEALRPIRLQRASAAAVQPHPQRSQWWGGLLAAASWAGLGALTLLWDNAAAGFTDWSYTTEFGWLALAVATLLLTLAVLPLERSSCWFSQLQHAAPWLTAIAVGLSVWEMATAKTAALPTPFFAPPQSLIDVYLGDWPRLGESLVGSVRLLSVGIVLGGLAGFLTGVLMGWSRLANYWIHPVLRFLGPVPTTALLPSCFYFFPSSWSTAVFLIALSMAFPVAVLTWSGVVSVNKNFYDVARTMGASSWFLIWRVAVPAALPQVFVGLFMGLGAAFSTLVVAEMLGVKVGLGWYLTWAQGWASYPNMYGALILMALLFSSVISLLFTVRDRVLVWQKGVVKW